MIRYLQFTITIGNSIPVYTIRGPGWEVLHKYGYVPPRRVWFSAVFAHYGLKLSMIFEEATGIRILENRLSHLHQEFSMSTPLLPSGIRDNSHSALWSQHSGCGRFLVQKQQPFCGFVSSTVGANPSLRKRPFLLALRRWGRFAFRVFSLYNPI